MAISNVAVKNPQKRLGSDAGSKIVTKALTALLTHGLFAHCAETMAMRGLLLMYAKKLGAASLDVDCTHLPSYTTVPLVPLWAIDP